MDPVQKAKSAMGGFERFLTKIPGYAGYKQKEMRREVDKTVRENLARELESLRRKLTGVQEQLLADGGLLWMDDMERVVGRLQLLIDRVKTAAYGYAPFFDVERVKEEQLDRLLEFDQALFNQLPDLESAIDAVSEAVESQSEIKAAIRKVGTLLADLNETFGRRMQSIHAPDA